MAEECDKVKILPCSADSSALLSFVLPYEKLCVALVSHILQGKSHFFQVQTDDAVVRDVFSFSDSGQIFHCFPDAYGQRRGELLRILTDFFRSQQEHEFFNVIGEEKGTDLIKQAVLAARRQKIQHEQKYLLLEQKSSGDKYNFNRLPTMRDEYEKLAILRCSPDMIDLLLPLQIAYEKEEVLWQNEPLDEHVTRLSFHRALRTQQVFALSKNGRFIAKGGTNAQGKKYVQLGGMYTLPSERGKGYGSEVLRHISAEMKAQGKKMVLFAKVENAPALHLYKKCGFAKIGRFEIAYF